MYTIQYIVDNVSCWNWEKGYFLIFLGGTVRLVVRLHVLYCIAHTVLHVLYCIYCIVGCLYNVHIIYMYYHEVGCLPQGHDHEVVHLPQGPGVEYEEVWLEHRTGDGRVYYSHPHTHKTMWERPKGARIITTQPTLGQHVHVLVC